jgi:ribosome biogenesis GTPase
MSSLKDLGWTPAWALKLRPEESACVIGRTAFESRGIYHVLAGDGKTWMAELKGILRKGAGARADFPIVGDWVLLEPQDGRRGLILRVLPRDSALIRREQSRNEATRRASSTQILAANVDWALITSSLNEEWNVRRLERYLGLVREAKIKPALLLTKTDLAEDGGDAVEAEARAVAPDLPILRFNALKGEGIGELKALLGTQGTAVLLGSSGVGKSTLVNALLGRQEMATGEVREKDQRGRHTTVGRHLLPLPWGGCLIDSPGLRDLGLTDEHAVDEAFEDITALALQCRFSDCRHEEEPGCAVQEAIANGKLDADRFDAYIKLKEETSAAKKRTQIGAVRYERDRGKAVGKGLKSFYKEKGGK